ncbi:unnamed protein product [Rotaria sp. Silwood1]|nr:unnamed protein product [Rotaria sp. Silwood1]
MMTLPTDTNVQSCAIYANKKSTTYSHECKICGASARYFYFGVLSCDSCKMFFRRNAKLGQEAFQCRFGGQCQVNIYNRHVCSSCRLAKCFKSGMKIEMFRLSKLTRKNKINQTNETKTKQISQYVINVIRQNQIQKLPTLNLLQSDTSLMTNSQWTLLSNVIHSFDERKIMFISQCIIKQDKTCQSMILLDETLINEFFSLLFETTNLCLCSNGDLSSLSSDDRSLILLNSTDSVLCLGGIFILYQSQLINCPSFLNILHTKYGEQCLSHTIHGTKLIDSDIVLTKIALALLLFSTNICLFSSNSQEDHIDTHAIFLIQNTYAEITWKYLLYRYGHDGAVLKFINLIECLLLVMQTLFHLQNVQQHVNDVLALIENTELKLLVDDIDQIDQKPMN